MNDASFLTCGEKQKMNDHTGALHTDAVVIHAALELSKNNWLLAIEATFERQRPLSWRGGPLYLAQPTPLGEVCQDRLSPNRNSDKSLVERSSNSPLRFDVRCWVNLL